MTEGPFELGPDSLPEVLAIFPLPGAVLLPRQKLPLNIFEPRYLAMVEDALRTTRHIGMIQPLSAGVASDPAPVFSVGCAGRITSFQETDDSRLLIELKGVCRYRVAEEIGLEKGYRRIRPDWRPYLADLDDAPDTGVSVLDLEASLKSYLEMNGLKMNWELVGKLPPTHLVDFLTTSLPLEVEEKQALLESTAGAERARLLRSTLEIALKSTSAPGPRLH